MRKNFGAKPWSYPQPVFIIAAYDEAGNPDAMNAAWGGISDTEEVSSGPVSMLKRPARWTRPSFRSCPWRWNASL